MFSGLEPASALDPAPDPAPAPYPAPNHVWGTSPGSFTDSWIPVEEFPPNCVSCKGSGDVDGASKWKWILVPALSAAKPCKACMLFGAWLLST